MKQHLKPNNQKPFLKFQTSLTQFNLNYSNPSALLEPFYFLSQFTYSWFLGLDLVIQPSLTLTSINHGSILGLEIPDMRKRKMFKRQLHFILLIFIPGHSMHAMFYTQSNSSIDHWELDSTTTVFY